jgi:hypothetical protein
VIKSQRVKPPATQALFVTLPPALSGGHLIRSQTPIKNSTGNIDAARPQWDHRFGPVGLDACGAHNPSSPSAMSLC